MSACRSLYMKDGARHEESPEEIPPSRAFHCGLDMKGNQLISLPHLSVDSVSFHTNFIPNGLEADNAIWGNMNQTAVTNTGVLIVHMLQQTYRLDDRIQSKWPRTVWGENEDKRLGASSCIILTTDLNWSSMCEPRVGMASGWMTYGVKSTTDTLSWKCTREANMSDFNWQSTHVELFRWVIYSFIPLASQPPKSKWLSFVAWIWGYIL